QEERSAAAAPAAPPLAASPSPSEAGVRTQATTTLPATPSDAPAARGRVLFRDKGCVTCHVNGRVEGQTGWIRQGPDLTNYVGDPAFLRTWLANPPAVRPATLMPNLGLSQSEIADLTAFLAPAR
ncbi:MAG: c-type cytochrome, partial [Chloroflexi bacterium]|nr:c-type cytochrome [Chloroflexota bacterium]